MSGRHILGFFVVFGEFAPTFFNIWIFYDVFICILAKNFFESVKIEIFGSKNVVNFGKGPKL